MIPDLQINIRRSKRKSFTLQFEPDGTLTVKAPLGVTDARIRQLLEAKEKWISEKAAQLQSRPAAVPVEKLTEPERRALCQKAEAVFAARVSYWAPIIGVQFSEISIRTQRTRWGSATGRGHLCFNALLLLAPPEVLDSVVVHELCHLKVMNHSDLFYSQVLAVYPEYGTAHAWLKQNGEALINRLP